MSHARKSSKAGPAPKAPEGWVSRAVPFDAADYLENEQDFAIFLTEALSDGTANEILHALGTCCRARGASKVARAAGMGVAQLAMTLTPQASPPMSALLTMVHALGLQLEVKPRKARAAAKSQARAKPAARRATAGSRRR